MYLLNSLGRPTLITSLEVIQRASSNHTLDALKLQTAIEIAEARFILPFLGHVLYYSLVEQKNKIVPGPGTDLDQLQQQLDQQIAKYDGEPYELQTGDIVNAEEYLQPDSFALWRNGLHKYCAEAVMIVAFPDNYVQFTSQGIVKNNPTVPIVDEGQDKSVGIDLKDLKFLMDQGLQSRLEPLRLALHGYICRNRSKYVTYPHPCEDCLSADGSAAAQAQTKNTSWVTGIYDDDDDYTQRRSCR